ncbi:MAG: hypothetical protein IJ658_12525 [Kiritimatiellae bacterium]|nr:hypothetical protein [Kiritimatiellia bacterium]
MALTINNAQFNQFVQFAEQQMQAGKSKAVAEIGGRAAEGPLAGRTIIASTVDHVGTFIRFQSLKDDNNDVRDLFRSAVAKMFGGESNIPKSVLDAMKLQDYGKGKPLTARRIIAVKNAIDASGVLQQKAFEASISTFNDQAGMAKIALEKGYTKSELPKLAAATNLYAKATGCSEAEALEAVAEPNSKANRLMNYGGRFLQNVDNFKEGLRLMESFKEWFTQVRETKNANGEATSLTGLNIAQSVTTHDATAAFERFVFDELAVNGSLDLKETDPEKIFGVKNNAAMRFFAANRCLNFVGVLANMPPERRGAVYQVFDKLSLPLAETKNEALSREGKSAAERGVDNPHLVIGRILRHLPEIEKLAAKGALTEKNIVKTLFPDVQPRSWTRAAMNHFTHHIDTLAANVFMADAEDEAEAQVSGMKVQLIMEETCCTFQEAIDACKTGRRVAPPQYMTTATFSIEKLDGTTNAARKQLDGNKMGDLWRPYNYAPADDPNNTSKFFIKDSANVAFGFTFPDGTSLKANAAEHAGNIPTILDKLESLAGKVHPRQQSAVMFAVSQAGVGVLKGGLTGLGVQASEHAAVDFTISKSDVTGDITIRYSSPKELPFAFEWTATVATDGTVRTTPLRVTDEATLKKELTSAAETIRNARGIKALPPDEQEKVVNTILDNVKGDRDLLALLTMNDGLAAFGVAVNGASHVRSEEKIAKMMEELRGNINELRVAAGGNPRVFDIGLKQLATLGGTALKSGVITKMGELAAKEDLGVLKGLSASSSPEKIFQAMCDVDRMVNNLFIETKVLQTFDGDPRSIDSPGATEAGGATGLALGLLLARCDQDTLNGLRDAMHSAGVRKVMQALDMLGNGRFPEGTMIDPTVRVVISEQVAPTMAQELRLGLTNVVNDALGIEETDISQQEPDKYELPTVESFARITDLIEEHTVTVFSSRI